MRQRFKMMLVALCTMALMITPMSAAWGDPTSGEMTATNQTNTEDPASSGMQRTDTFMLDDRTFFQSLGGDSGKPTLTLSTSKIQEIVKSKLLPQWSGIAASVFREQSSQLVDLYGEQPSGGNMTWSGFDAYFRAFGSFCG